MGDMADSLINGDFDFYTGEYIGRGYGFPRWRGMGNKKRNAKSGVTKWLTVQGVTDKQAQTDLLRKYLSMTTNNDTKEYMCIQISQDFDKFRKWFKENK